MLFLMSLSALHVLVLKVPSSLSPTEYPDFRLLGCNIELPLMCDSLAHGFWAMLRSRFWPIGYVMLLNDYFSNVYMPFPPSFFKFNLILFISVAISKLV